MSNPFVALNQKRGVLLASHRGYYGGNIPFNSKPAFCNIPSTICS